MGQDLTRRQALKRGAAVSGALLWATPAIQTIGMSKALAASPSCLCTMKLDIECVATDDGHTVYATVTNKGTCDITDIVLLLNGVRTYERTVDLLTPGQSATRVTICREFDTWQFTLTATGYCNGMEITGANDGVTCEF